MVILKGTDFCEAAAVPQGSGSDLAWGRRGEATIGPPLMIYCSFIQCVLSIKLCG